MSFPVHIQNQTISSRTSFQSTSALATGSHGYCQESPFTTGQASSGPEPRPSTTTGTRSEGLREEFRRGAHLAARSCSGKNRSGVVPSADGGWAGTSQTCGPPMYNQEGETSGGGQTFVEGPSTTRELTPPQQQNEETRGREQPPNARDGSETVAAEAGGRDAEEESRGPEIGTEEPRRSTRIRRPPDRLYRNFVGRSVVYY